MIDLFKISFSAHIKYLSNHIFRNRDKKMLEKSHKNIMYLLNYIDNFTLLKKELKKPSRRKTNYLYYTKGYKIALEVIESLEKRF